MAREKGPAPRPRVITVCFAALNHGLLNLHHQNVDDIILHHDAVTRGQLLFVRRGDRTKCLRLQHTHTSLPNQTDSRETAYSTFRVVARKSEGLARERISEAQESWESSAGGSVVAENQGLQAENITNVDP